MKRFIFVCVVCVGLFGCGGAEFTASGLFDPGTGVPDTGEPLGSGHPDTDAATETSAPEASSHDTDSGPIFVDSGFDADDGNACNKCGAQSVCVSGTCAPAYRVFVTALAYAADFGGATGADGVCQKAATTSNLGGKWKAWVSDSTTSPVSRFVQSSSMSYRLLDGTPIASNWTSLTSGLLFHVIDVYEDGTKIATNWNATVWTNTEGNGYASAGQACHDFTSIDGTTNPNVATGITDRLDPNKWSHDFEGSCAGTQHFYCFEQ
jgi:hypothetical protein